MYLPNLCILKPPKNNFPIQAPNNSAFIFARNGMGRLPGVAREPRRGPPAT